MRAIRFRGKYIHGEEWLFGYFHRNNFGDCYIADGFGTSTAVDPKTVSQYVCTAKNGEMIYEGDIVEDEFGDIYLVEYSSEDFGFLTAKFRVQKPIYRNPEWITKQLVRVIGNIWDSNLEDFKKEKEE